MVFVINVTVGTMYRTPDFQSAVVSQALLGETCDLLEERDQWVNIRQWDGYQGWITRVCGTTGSRGYDPSHWVSDRTGILYSDRELETPLLSLTFGNRLKIVDHRDGLYRVELPDTTRGWTRAGMETRPLTASRAGLVQVARKFVGTPYLWGGKSPFGFDCSGFVQTVFRSVGLDLPRDTWQQAGFFSGRRIAREQLEPGDLIFFGTENRISHVALTMTGDTFIHAQGSIRTERFLPARRFRPELETLYRFSVTVQEMLA